MVIIDSTGGLCGANVAVAGMDCFTNSYVLYLFYVYTKSLLRHGVDAYFSPSLW